MRIEVLKYFDIKDMSPHIVRWLISMFIPRFWKTKHFPMVTVALDPALLMWTIFDPSMDE